MSVAKMRGDAWTYYAREVATSVEDYYVGIGEEPGRWWGRQAEGFDLAGGEVGEEPLRRVFAGLDPTTGDQLGRAFGDRSINGIAAAFSAPKSVSLLWALGDDTVSKQVRAAHRAATEQALGYLEHHACLTRVGPGGRHQVDAAGFTVAIFEHRTSRLGDPQLHAHALIATKVRDPEGRWLSLDTNEIYANVRTAGAVYQAALRAGLTNRLGVEWGPTNGHGQADLRAVDRRLIEAFSKRSAQTDAALKAWVAAGVAGGTFPAGYEPTRADVQRAVLASRPGKDRSIGPDALRHGWRDEAATLGLNTRRLQRAVLDKGTLPAVDRVALTGEVLDALVTGQATFAYRHVVREVAARVAADRATVEKLAEGVLADKRAISLAAPDDPSVPDELRRANGRPVWLHERMDRWTTTDQLALEAQVIDYAKSSAQCGVANAMAVRAALVSRELDVGQSAVVSHLLTSGRPLDVVVAGAGTGKSHALGAAGAGWERAGHRIVAMAPKGTAAAIMRAEGLVGADTVAKFIREWDHQVPARAYALRVGDVVLVDEAATLGTKDLSRVVGEAQRVGAKVVLVGDDRQLGSVEAGGMFAHLAAGDGVARLTKVHRQRQAWERDAAQGLRARNVDALAAYEDHDRVHAGDRAEMLHSAYGAWAADRADGVDSVMLAARRADVDVLNANARRSLVDAGEVARRGIEVGSQTVGRGDIVLTTSPDRRMVASNGHWVLNGDRWRVDKVARSGELTVTHVDHGGRIRLGSAYVSEHVDLGYASTVHKAQGTTVDRAHLLVDDHMTGNHLYAGMTRGRDMNHAYVVTEELGPEPECDRPATGARSALELLTQVLQRPEDDAAAHTVLRHNFLAAEHAPATGQERGKRSEVGTVLGRRREREEAERRLGLDKGVGR